MSSKGKYKVEALVTIFYVLLWAVALTIPVAYNLIGG